MTDGWYSIRVKLDEYLQNLVKERKIYVGQKLYMQGAELCGSDQAVSPLEVCNRKYNVANCECNKQLQKLEPVALKI